MSRLRSSFEFHLDDENNNLNRPNLGDVTPEKKRTSSMLQEQDLNSPSSKSEAVKEKKKPRVDMDSAEGLQLSKAKKALLPHPPFAKKTAAEPVSGRGLATALPVQQLNDEDYDHRSIDDEQRDMVSTRKRRMGPISDGSIIMDTQTKRRPAVILNINDTEKSGISFAHEDHPDWPLDRNLSVSVIRLLDSDSAKSAALTCRFFANCCNRRTALRFSANVTGQDIALVLATKCFFLKDLDLSQCTHLRSIDFKEFAKTLYLQRFVAYPEITADALTVLAQNNKELISLKLKFPQYCKSVTAYYQALHAFPNMADLHLEHCFLHGRNFGTSVNKLVAFLNTRNPALEVTFSCSRRDKLLIEDRMQNKLENIHFLVK